MKNSIYKKYCGQKLPEDFQKRAEGFASTDDIMKEFEAKWAATENPFCP